MYSPLAFDDFRVIKTDGGRLSIIFYRLLVTLIAVAQEVSRSRETALKEIGTIKRFYSVYGVYYVLLHFIQSSVITKCGFIPEKRS